MTSMTRPSLGASGGGAGKLARRLGLAATPTFAAMALLSAMTGEANMICSASRSPLPFSDMVAMYLLMAVFHLSHWLKR
jgi:hypothetical protein